MFELPEPWRNKVVEPIHLLDRADREACIEAAGFNLFRVPSEAIFIDLFTDSGTSAQSDAQWAGLMMGDEAYAGSRNFYHLEETVREVFGFPHVVPVHQGRAGESLVFGELVPPGSVVPNNTHFDTTRANLEARGAIAVDLLVPEGHDPGSLHPFKGNIDLEALRELVAGGEPGRVPLVLLTLTNNAGGGQPASLENIRGCAEICRELGVPFWIDACRFAENAWFIRRREAGQGARPVAKIVRDIFEHADGCLMSAKKDGLANIGGFVAGRDRQLVDRLRQKMLLTEGFPTYGGLAGRDLEAVARGLREVLDERYLRFRVGQVEAFGRALVERGIPIVQPTGGHAVYIDAGRLLPAIPPREFPGQVLAVALYREGGIRGVEVGSVMFGHEDPETGEERHPPLELVRLAIPRRVYNATHLAYVTDVLAEIRERRSELRGLRIASAPAVLRHFSARFEEIAPAAVS